MISTEEKIAERLQRLRGILAARNDGTRARRIEEMESKLGDPRLTVAFCGHFSAGKSSMLNYLLGEEVLPSSPIPTSANVVVIKGAAQQEVIIHLRDGKVLRDSQLGLLSQWQSYMTDGQQVDQVEIALPAELLQNGLVFLDTPGIDSTDAAHQMAAESALHVADVICYVVDYNHVLSEENLLFIQEVTSYGKQVVLIVNQIDKNLSWEISFSQFKENIIHSLKDWHIELPVIFYTSLKEEDHPHNEIAQLQQFFAELLRDKDALIDANLFLEVLHQLEEHQVFLREQNKGSWEELLQLLQRQDLEQVLHDGEKTVSKNAHLAGLPHEMEAAFRKELDALLANAPITPFETRELARSFIQCRERAEKRGIFGLKQKRKQEMEQALQAFHKNFREKVQLYLLNHLRQLCVEVPERYFTPVEAYRQEVYHFDVAWDEALLVGALQRGPTGEAYVMNYMKDLSAKVKDLYRRAALHLFGKAAASFQEVTEEKRKALEKDLQEYGEILHAQQRLAFLQHEEADSLRDLYALFSLPFDMGELERMQRERQREAGEILRTHREQLLPIQAEWSGQPQLSPQWEPSVPQKGVAIPQIRQYADGMNQTEGSREAVDLPSAEAGKEDESRLREWAEQLTLIANELSGLPGLERVAVGLQERAERLQKRRYTVALFGAFSAGKSSFANALLGERLLPVSPHPTTAAINLVHPADDSHPHGTVVVHMKTASQLRQDVTHALQALGATEQVLKDFFPEEAAALPWESLQPKVLHTFLSSLKSEQVSSWAQGHRSFTQAVVTGWERQRHQLGEQLQMGWEAFHPYVAEESLACFVDRIELYCQSPLGDKGITLVDTPGADSIHARHTGVAFEYMKQADALFFVTYYNHAFSRSDKEFLLQMGRIQDSFQRDKMFFLLNAADLSHSLEELEGVVGHLRDELQQFGITKPRIYPVSSQRALMAQRLALGNGTEEETRFYRQRWGEAVGGMARELEEAGLTLFLQDFQLFTLHELSEVARRAALQEGQRGQQALERLVRLASEDAGTRARRREAWLQSQETAVRLIEGLPFTSREAALRQEVDELLYYVNQRAFLRFPEFFQASFVSIEGESSREIREKLDAALRECLQFFGQNLLQEIRATTLRVERVVQRQAQEVYHELLQAVMQVEEAWVFSPFEPVSLQTPDLTPPDAILRYENYAHILRDVKGLRRFYEQGGSQRLRERLYESLRQPIESFLKDCAQQMGEVYVASLYEQVERMKRGALQELDGMVEGFLLAQATAMDLAVLHRKKANVVEACQRLAN